MNKPRGAPAAFHHYLHSLCAAPGRADWSTGLRGYFQGLMHPLERKGVELMATYRDPRHVRASHQALHHFVTKSEWSDAAVLEHVRAQVRTWLDVSQEVNWIVDDTGFSKKGRHTVGVARQYCGELGGGGPLAGGGERVVGHGCGERAESRAAPPVGRRRGRTIPNGPRGPGFPRDIPFATKPENAATGTNTTWRDTLVDMDLRHVVGMVSSLGVWASPQGPAPPPPWSGKVRQPARHGRTAEHLPVSVKALAHTLKTRSFRTVRWREGNSACLISSFTNVVSED